MPNGVMSGDGTKGNPFVVMDGYDFNALRNISTSTSDYKYIKLGADINLSMYVSFEPIPEKHFNIDGAGHMITDINIISSSSEVGLFARLYSNEYIKDLTIEGELSCNSSSSITGGAFCGRLFLLTDAVVSNVEAYFSVVYTTTSGLTVGGLAGIVEVSGRSNSAIKECAFKGSLEASSTNSGTVYNMIIGGLFGQLYSSNPNASDLFLIEKCITEINYKVNNRLNMRMGGILGDMGQGYNSGTVCFQVSISKCVAKVTMQFTHPSAVTTNIHRVSGITCYPGFYASQVSTVEKCVAFIDMLWTHKFPINDFRMAGLLYAGTEWGQKFKINQGYAVMRMINPENLPWTGCSANLGSVTFLPSSSPLVEVVDAFFDKEVFSEHYDGVFTETHGITTAQLKDAEFLKSKGWDFDG